MGTDEVTSISLGKRLEKKDISITVNGKVYVISSHFSLNDTKLLLETLESGNSAKLALATVIQKNAAPTPSLDELCVEPDISFEPFIMSVINDSNELKTYFDETDKFAELSQRFVVAVEQQSKDFAKKIAETLRPTFENLEQFKKSVDLGEVTQFLQQIAKKTAEIMAPIQETMSQFSSTFSKLLAGIHLPTYPSERKKDLEESYRAWGVMGWSAISHAPIDLFNQVPASIAEADKIALYYFNKKGLDDLFAEMKTQPIKKEDFNSALFCFENRQYKACAMLLFGIIDAKLIRLQPKPLGTKRRSVGKRAVLALESKFHSNSNEEQLLFFVLYFLGLIESLSTFFADGNDFNKEPTVINRNFVNHGMNVRRVRRKDCIQLFLALHNLIELLEIII